MLLPVLIALGFWQLQRAEFKQGLQDLYEQRSVAAPVAFSELVVGQDIAYLPVQLQGRFDNKHHFLLDNRVLNGRPGYEVMSAFLLVPAVTKSNGEVFDFIWVNRGWIPLVGSRDSLPNISVVAGQMITLHGQLVNPSKAFVLADVPLTGVWPEVVQSIELEHMTKRLLDGNVERSSAPYLLRVAAGEVSSFEVNWQAVNTAPQKSLGYAVQWFLMALVLSGLYVWAGLKRKRPHQLPDQK